MKSRRPLLVWTTAAILLTILLQRDARGEEGNHQRGHQIEQAIENEVEDVIQGVREEGRDDGSIDYERDENGQLRLPDIDGTGTIEKQIEQVKIELTELQKAKDEIARRMEQRRKELAEKPGEIDEAKHAIEQDADDAPERRRAAADAAAKAQLAESELNEAQARALAALKENNEFEHAEGEVDDLRKEVEEAAAPSRKELSKSIDYQVAVETAKRAETRLEFVKEQQAAGRASPRDLVEAMTAAKQADLAVRDMEEEMLAGNDNYQQAKEKLSAASARLENVRRRQAELAKADPSYASALAKAKEARDREMTARRQIIDAAKDQQKSAAAINKAHRQMKVSKADLATLEAAAKKVDDRIKQLTLKQAELEKARH